MANKNSVIGYKLVNYGLKVKLSNEKDSANIHKYLSCFFVAIVTNIQEVSTEEHVAFVDNTNIGVIFQLQR